MKAVSVAATAALLMCAPAFAQEKMDAQTFVEKATMTDMTEIKAGEMAQEDGQSDEVKEFGKHMVMDHTKLSNELKQAIKEHKIEVKLPDQLDDAHQDMIEKLDDADGDEFDKVYSQMQVKGHTDAVALFEGYAKSGDNEHLKKAASKALPTIKKHLEEAKTLPGAK